MDFDFDDSVFVTKTRSTTGDKLTSYNAKVCSPLWFEDEDSTVDSDVKHLQYSADYHYGMCDYQTAMHKYTQLLETFPESGRSRRRDILESLARCHLKLNNLEKALSYTKLLSEHASSDDHEVQTLSLFHEIYKEQHDFEDDIAVLQKLVGYHTHHYVYWFQLAEAYKGIEDNFDVDSENLTLRDKIFSSYLRALVLLQYSLKFSGLIMKPKLQEMSKQINEKVGLFDVSVEDRLQAEKHLCRDLPNEFNYTTKSLEDDKNDPPKVVLNTKKLPFEKKWFSWRNQDHSREQNELDGLT